VVVVGWDLSDGPRLGVVVAAVEAEEDGAESPAPLLPGVGAA
jgi:hypothetical protein